MEGGALDDGEGVLYSSKARARSMPPRRMASAPSSWSSFEVADIVVGPLGNGD